LGRIRFWVMSGLLGMLALLMNYTTRRGDASVDRDWWDDDEWRGTLTKPELRELSLRVPATDLVRSSIAQPAKITVEQLQRVSNLIGDALQGYRTSEILVDVVNFLDAVVIDSGPFADASQPIRSRPGSRWTGGG